MSGQELLINALKNPDCYDHSISKLQVIETHISWVILTGEYAYKIKKSIDLGFLNFSTLEKRKHFCQLELQLNSRLAPNYYLDVIPITGSYENPNVNGEGSAIEYALKMVEFPQHAELDRELEADNLDTNKMNRIAEKIAEFHKKIHIADEKDSFGDFAKIHQSVLNTYNSIFEQIDDEKIVHRVESLLEWSSSENERLKPVLIQRKLHGYIRECHGDLHLRNIAIVNDEVVAFDCIEFNEDLRWNDVISEIAFLVMDLDDHNRSDLANCFLNRYLELTGDYSGLMVLRYYLVYRAVVRAMVASIRLHQEKQLLSTSSANYVEFSNYLSLAERYTKPHSPVLLITFGFSGSGKTTVTQSLLEKFPFIRVRSDIERKRLHNIEEKQREERGVERGIYSTTASELTYQHLFELAGELLQANYAIIVDATFLSVEYRFQFQQLAEKLNAKFGIVHCQASRETMERRVERRSRKNNDASDADLSVLTYQIENDEGFSPDENKFRYMVNTEDLSVMNDLYTWVESEFDIPCFTR